MTGPSFSYGATVPPRKPTTTTPAAPAAAAPAAVAPADLIRETTTRDFMRDVIDASATVPVLVDFWAEWCGPCKQLTPVIEKVVRAAKGRVRLVKMNIDQHPEVAGQLGIRSIPAVIAFKGGQPVDGFMGAVPEGQIQTFIDKLAGPAGPSPAEVILAEAAEAVAAGDAAGAARLYAAVLEQDPDNLDALVGFGDVHLGLGELDVVRRLIEGLPPALAKDPRVGALQARLDLAVQTAAVGDSLALEARVAHDPDDHQARFDLALVLAGKGHRQAAIDHLIEIVRRDRTWTDDGARRQLVQFFEAWGPKDPDTLYGRRRLSSVLFS